MEFSWQRTRHGTVAHLEDPLPDDFLRYIAKFVPPWQTSHPHRSDAYDLVRPAPPHMRKCLICVRYIEDVEHHIDQARREWAEDQLRDQIEDMIDEKVRHAPF